jgi:hypothetical protein
MRVELALCEWSTTDWAVTVTWPPVGTTAGAVYVVAIPLSVEGGLNNPQVFAGVQLQATPAWVLSFETVAEIAAVPPGTTLDGSGDKATEIARDCVSGGVPDCEEPPAQLQLNKATTKAVRKKNDSPLTVYLNFMVPLKVLAGLFSIDP